MISQSDLFKSFRMISRRVISCDECALRFYVCSIFVDRVFLLFILHHGVHWTYKCFAYVAPRGWIWVRRGLCGFGDIRGSVGRYDPWGIKAAGFAITTKINHYARLHPLVYGTTASPLWLELRGHSAWQVTPSWTVYRLACHRLLPWLRVTFAMVPDAAWPGSDQWPWSTAPATGPVGRLGRPSASDPWGIGSFLSLGRPMCVQCPGPLGSCSPVCPRGLLWCVCGVLGRLAPVHRCARSVCCVACAVSWATGLLFTGVRAVCGARVPWVVVSLFLPP